MTRKNLSDAFGEIDDTLFAIAETENESKSLNESPAKSANDVQAPVFIKNIRETKVRNRRKAIISATAGIAACAVLAVSLPLLFNNTVPPYEAVQTTEALTVGSLTQQPVPAETSQQTVQIGAITQPAVTDTEQDPSQIQLYTKIKEILNAEDMYKVEKTQIDLSGFEENGLGENAYGNPFFNVNIFIDGSSFFYTLVG
ncbi:MAG: hypothetical protein K2N36_06380, partial [Ruminiclostridium sp.]|nr:hypothetical protein [Ruminiclostridium sp.]